MQWPVWVAGPTQQTQLPSRSKQCGALTLCRLCCNCEQPPTLERLSSVLSDTSSLMLCC